MMSDMSGQGGQTVVAVESQQIKLEFYWGKSCFKGKYPRWRPTGVTQLLVTNGFTDEYLVHELSVCILYIINMLKTYISYNNNS